MSPEMHDRVMNRASRLWHERGKPDGRYRELWEEARREVMNGDGDESEHFDELASWAPPTPRPRHKPSTLRRWARSTERSVREVIDRL